MPIFAKQGEYEPCGIFTKEHFLLILLTIIGIKISLKKTINKTNKEVKQIIKKNKNLNINTTRGDLFRQELEIY